MPSRPCLPCRQLWTCPCTCLALAFGTFISTLWYITQAFSVLFRVDMAPMMLQALLGGALQTSFCGADRSMYGLLKLLPSHASGFSFHRSTLYLWIPHILYAFEASNSCSIGAFHYTPFACSHLPYLFSQFVLTCFLVACMSNAHNQSCL